MLGDLYIVATPIGNLEDITLRAIKVLKEVDIIAAEDTRHTLKLLNHLEISKPLISYHRHNEETRSEDLIKYLEEGKNIALVSDAGTPVISDPGEEVIKEAIKKNIKIIPIPGACALINALIVSGFNAKEFTFIGFLPLNNKLRKEKMEEIKDETKTMIIYEAPHKLKATIEEFKEIIPNRNIVLAKELTKIHENFYRGKASELLEICDNVKGEFIIVIEGAEKKENEEVEFLKDLDINEHYKYYEKQGMEKKEIIKKIAKDRKVPKNEIYKMFL